MKVETKELEYCKVKVFYEADKDSVQEKEKEAIAELRRVAIPGFRPGKAPDHAIRVRAKNRIRQWVANEMRAQAFDDVIFETKMKAIGSPEFENISLKNGNFSCEMTILKKPEFVLAEYKGFEIPKPHMDRDVDAQVEATIQDLRTRFGNIEPYQEGDFVQTNDQVTLDFEATIDGESFEGSSESGILYTVGVDKKWPEFDENLLGMTPGETREFDVKFPEDVPILGGKTAKFKATIHMGTKRVPCPMNDELAQKVGLNSFQEVRQKISVIVNERIRNTEDGLVRQQIANRLVDAHDFEVPAWLASMEAQNIAAQNGIDWEHLDNESREVFLDQAKRNVKLSLVLDSIRDEEPEAMLSEAEAVQNLKQQLVTRGVDPDRFFVENRRNGRLLGMIAALKDEFALQWLMSKSKVIEA